MQDRWGEVRAFEIEVEDVRSTLICDDVLMPEVRDLLETCKRRLHTLAAETPWGDGPMPLATPGAPSGANACGRSFPGCPRG